MIVGVLLPLPFNKIFDYRIDEDAQPGEMVRVSFGKEVLVGVIWKTGKEADIDLSKIKPVIEKLSFPP